MSNFKIPFTSEELRSCFRTLEESRAARRKRTIYYKHTDGNETTFYRVFRNSTKIYLFGKWLPTLKETLPETLTKLPDDPTEKSVCHSCKIMLGYKRVDEGFHTATKLECKVCGEVKGILPWRYYK